MQSHENLEYSLTRLITGPNPGRRFFSGFLTGVEIMRRELFSPPDSSQAPDVRHELEQVIRSEEDQILDRLAQYPGEESEVLIDVLVEDEAALGSLHKGE